MASTKSRYTVAFSEQICHELSNGKPLKQICREQNIHWSTIYDWRGRFPDFAERLQRARDIGEEAIAAECLEIADDTSEDYLQSDQGPVFNREHVQRSKLRIETRLKLLAKWNPTKWGERLQQNVTLTRNPSEMGIDDIRAELAAMATAQGRGATAGSAAEDGEVS